jgi:TusA-related sulfurtransferase
MYRRIELISHLPIDVEGMEQKMLDIKGGICFVPVKEGIFEVWMDMPAPKKNIQKNCRFYFTEKGWDVYGRAIVKACQKVGQEYRVIRIKENSVDVFYKDEIQVVVRPLKKRT